MYSTWVIKTRKTKVENCWKAIRKWIWWIEHPKRVDPGWQIQFMWFMLKRSCSEKGKFKITVLPQSIAWGADWGNREQRILRENRPNSKWRPRMTIWWWMLKLQHTGQEKGKKEELKKGTKSSLNGIVGLILKLPRFTSTGSGGGLSTVSNY